MANWFIDRRWSFVRRSEWNISENRYKSTRQTQFGRPSSTNIPHDEFAITSAGEYFVIERCPSLVV